MSSIVEKIQRQVPLHPLTTFRIGGPASYFLIADTEEELAEAVNWAASKDLPFFLLGAGSNILVADEGFPGLVVKLGNEFAKIEFDEASCTVTAGAGLALPRLGNTLVDQGWEGFEFMCCIPGSVGGAVVMNAGTKHGEIKDVLTSVRVMKTNGEIHARNSINLAFAHRTSCFKYCRDIILSASFALKGKRDPALLRERVRRFIDERAAKQPKNPRNCGSIFKITRDGQQAWQYIEKAGFRSVAEGGALVAPEHANWIVNNDSASAQNIKQLIRRIQVEVQLKFGISLEREVIFVPDDLVQQ